MGEEADLPPPTQGLLGSSCDLQDLWLTKQSFTGQRERLGFGGLVNSGRPM